MPREHASQPTGKFNVSSLPSRNENPTMDTLVTEYGYLETHRTWYSCKFREHVILLSWWRLPSYPAPLDIPTSRPIFPQSKTNLNHAQHKPMAQSTTTDQQSKDDPGQRSSAPQPVTDEHTESASTVTFRISNIPSHLTGQQFLQTLDSDILDRSSRALENVLGWSFAPAISPHVEKFCIATIRLKSVPARFRSPDFSREIQLFATSPPLIIDKHFSGLTPLNFSEEPAVEYV